MKRILTAGVLIAVVLPIIRKGPLWLWWALVAAMALLAAFELVAILRAAKRPPFVMPALAGTLAVVFAFAWSGHVLAAALCGALALAAAWALAARGPFDVALDRLAATTFVVFYLGLTLGAFGALLGCDLPHAPDRGDMVVLAMLAVYLGDTAAMCGGMLFGRHRMAPRLSPKKTWEGAAAGVAGAVGGALLAPYWFARALPVGHAVALGAVVALAGLAGDLFESLLKRAAGIKDSGALLPGHGGVLDRIDSLLFAAPVFYWYHRVFLAG